MSAEQNILVITYFALMNLCGFLLFLIDKRKAIRQAWRIPEQTLLLVSAMGGCFGSLLSMFLFHHKTRKTMFRFGIPVLCIVWIIMMVFMKKLLL